MSFYHKIKKAPWLFKQPLTAIPCEKGMPVSDLFLWRNTGQWSTCFELINIAELFEDSKSDVESVKLYLFGPDGNLIKNVEIDIDNQARKKIYISDYLKDSDIECGTFSVFHMKTPSKITEMESFLTERGYVSYSYKSDFRSYVHGNLDAVSLKSDNKIQKLGVKGLLNREYHLQHELFNDAKYEIGVVNPCSKPITLKYSIIEIDTGNNLVNKVVNLPSLGSKIINIDKLDKERCRLILKSKMVMTRPLVFAIQGDFIDVFHG